MKTEEDLLCVPAALVEHLERFPEDLCDIRRLQKRYRLSATEVARALERWASSAHPDDAGGGAGR